MTHTWDPDRYLTYADERGRPFVELLAADRRRRRRGPVVDLGCGPGNLTALLADRWPEPTSLGLDSSPEMIAKARRDVPGIRLRGRRPARLGGRREPGRRTRLQRHPAVGARPPRPAAAPGRRGSRPAAGSPSRCPATSTSPATPSAPSSPPRTPYAAHTAGVAVPDSHDPAVYLDALAAARLRGRRLGDDVPARAAPARTRSSPGSPAPAPGRRCRRCPTTCAATSRRSSRRGCGRRTRPTSTACVLPFRRIFVVAQVPA